MSGSAERRAGFVLLEAVVALAILGLFTLALLSATAGQVRTAANAGELMNASALAEDRLMSIRLLEYDGLTDPPDSLLAGTFPPPFEAYRWTATVEEMEDEYDLFGVDVVVVGPSQIYPLRTLVHRPRPNLTAGDAEDGASRGGGGRR